MYKELRIILQLSKERRGRQAGKGPNMLHQWPIQQQLQAMDNNFLTSIKQFIRHMNG